MDLILHRNNELSRGLIARSEQKREFSKQDVVMTGLSETEYKAAACGVINHNESGQVVISSKPIKSLTQAEILREVKESIEFVVRDLGIKNFTGNDAMYQTSRFMKLLRDHYSNMTYKEVEFAFELLMTGMLDKWLPKNQHNEPDRGHYQSFSVEFITKVLNAYRQYQRGVWIKVHNLLPEPEKIYSEEEKQEAKNYLLKTIQRCFDLHIKGKPYEFIMPILVVKELSNYGLCGFEIEATEEDKKKAYSRIMQSQSIARSEKTVIKSAIEQSLEHTTMERVTKIIAAERIINQVFTELQKQKKNIKDLFNK